MRALLLALLFVACRTPPEATVPVAREHDAGAPAFEASSPDQATSDACPKSFVAAQTASCVLGQPPSQCEYVEADCACVAPAQCGGAYLPHPAGSPGMWSCTPRQPGVLRHDGCPFNPPANGTQCAKAGQTCQYGPCSWSRTTAGCVGGVWKVTQYMGPPPP